MQGNRDVDHTSLERDGVWELQGGLLRGETSQSILEDVWEECNVGPERMDVAQTHERDVSKECLKVWGGLGWDWAGGGPRPCSLKLQSSPHGF